MVGDPTLKNTCDPGFDTDQKRTLDQVASALRTSTNSASIFVEGEKHVGKRAVAKYLHQQIRRKLTCDLMHAYMPELSSDALRSILGHQENQDIFIERMDRASAGQLVALTAHLRRPKSKSILIASCRIPAHNPTREAYRVGPHPVTNPVEGPLHLPRGLFTGAVPNSQEKDLWHDLMDEFDCRLAIDAPNGAIRVMWAPAANDDEPSDADSQNGHWYHSADYEHIAIPDPYDLNDTQAAIVSVMNEKLFGYHHKNKIFAAVEAQFDLRLDYDNPRKAFDKSPNKRAGTTLLKCTTKGYWKLRRRLESLPTRSNIRAC